MKYTIREQKSIDKILKDLTKLDKNIKKKRQRIEQIEKDIDGIHVLRQKIQNKIYDINKKVVKRCKHIGDKHRVRNWRDDASFLYWIRCDDCGETVGHEGENTGRYN